MNAREARWEKQGQAHRDPARVAAQWPGLPLVDPALLRWRVRGAFWDAVEEAGPLVLTREYEHLVLALSVVRGRPRISCLPLPHPNGLAVDTKNKVLHVASTRNPNMIYSFSTSSSGPWLSPQRARYFPGSLYIHDLAMVGGKLYANAVGRNSVVEILERGGFSDRWWPRSVARGRKLRADRNYLQLNSIASGKTLSSSYFTASLEKPARRFPGDPALKVDRQGVLFSGRTRGVVARGLTRPHSARLRGQEIWIDDSGYGELVVAQGGTLTRVLRLPGWTRGLSLENNIAFVGTSRVLPRFRAYAPGLDLEKSHCGLHAVDLMRGTILGSLVWPEGNQIFAVESLKGLGVEGFFPDPENSNFYSRDL